MLSGGLSGDLIPQAVAFKIHQRWIKGHGFHFASRFWVPVFFPAQSKKERRHSSSNLKTFGSYDIGINIRYLER